MPGKKNSRVSRKKAATNAKHKRRVDESQTVPAQQTLCDRVSFVRPLWESLDEKARMTLLKVNLDDVLARATEHTETAKSGAEFGSDLILPLLQERREKEAMEDAARKASLAGEEILRMEEEEAKRIEAQARKKQQQKKKHKDKLRKEKERKANESKAKEQEKQAEIEEKLRKEREKEEQERKQKEAELEELRKAEEAEIEKRRQELLSDANNHWRRRLEEDAALKEAVRRLMAPVEGPTIDRTRSCDLDGRRVGVGRLAAHRRHRSVDFEGPASRQGAENRAAGASTATRPLRQSSEGSRSSERVPEVQPRREAPAQTQPQEVQAAPTAAKKAAWVKGAIPAAVKGKVPEAQGEGKGARGVESRNAGKPPPPVMVGPPMGPPPFGMPPTGPMPGFHPPNMPWMGPMGPGMRPMFPMVGPNPGFIRPPPVAMPPPAPLTSALPANVNTAASGPNGAMPPRPMFFFPPHMMPPGGPMMQPFMPMQGQWFGFPMGPPHGMHPSQGNDRRIKKFTLRPTAKEFIPPSLSRGGGSIGG